MEYPYLYETHMHTSQASRCAVSTGAEMAEAYHRAGYTGVIVTDHHYGGNCAVPRSLGWGEWVDRFCAGYEDARERGEKLGLDVFFGWEAGFGGLEFLVYGLTPEWMREHPELREPELCGGAGVGAPEKLYALVHAAGGMMIHAHPYREAPYIDGVRLYPDCIDGVEIVNAAHHSPLSHYNPSFDERAALYAVRHDFAVTAGSDAHGVQIPGGGMAFGRRLGSAQDFCRAVLEGEDCLLTDGQRWYDRHGDPVDADRVSE